ncbi:MAG: methyltransferase domain-containing protein [Gammaproteobacteria bacterium]|nr:methyltransferase domain-containing protein [Gammaproteobacteria bacterium]
MNIISANNLACPIDKLALTKRAGCYQCDNGHSFDIAKQGYVNLLPVQYKRSKDPGDSKAMVQARTRFLDAGFYQAVADDLSSLIIKNIPAIKSSCILDAGCGEGYYLNQVINATQKLNNENDIAFAGIDISKHAIIAASKRNKQASWIVGTNSQPPFLKQSIDLVFCIFGFHSFSGFMDILKPGGKVILVEPSANHLQELKAIIYAEPAMDKSKKPPATTNNYSLIESHTLQFQINLETNMQILDLLSMTPHLFRASHQGKANIETMDSLTLTADMIFRVFEYQP